MLTTSAITTLAKPLLTTEIETFWQQNAEHILTASHRFEKLSIFLGILYSEGLSLLFRDVEIDKNLFEDIFYSRCDDHADLLELCNIKKDDLSFLLSDKVWNKRDYDLLHEQERSLASEITYLGFRFFGCLKDEIKRAGFKLLKYEFPDDELPLSSTSEALFHLKKGFTNLADKVSSNSQTALKVLS